MKLIRRVFLTIKEVLKRFDGNEALLHELVDLHGLRLYARCHFHKAEHMDDETWFDSLERSGQHEYGHWHYDLGRPADHKLGPAEAHYSLTGWFEITRQDSLSIVTSGSADDVTFHSYVDGRQVGRFVSCGLGYPGLHVRYENARFRVVDIDRIANELQSTETTPSQGDDQRIDARQPATDELKLDPRERRSLLRTVHALLKLSKLQQHKATNAIEAELQKHGFDTPAAETIRKIVSSAMKAEPDEKPQ